MFFKEIPNWYYILIYCFQCNIFKTVFCCIFKLTSVCQNSVSVSNTKTVLLSEAVFFKDIPKLFYFRNACFHTNIFKMVFHCFIKLTMSLKTLPLPVIPIRYYWQSGTFRLGFQCIIQLTLPFNTLLLTVIPKRYYYQSSVFQRNTKMVLLFKLLFPM